MTYATKKYASNCQRNPKWRARHRLVHNPRANFVYPRASIKARERGEMRHPAVMAKLIQAMEMGERLKRGG